MIVKRGEYYHYQFQINGKRYRGSTNSTNKAEALRLEAAKRIQCLRNPEGSMDLLNNLNLTLPSTDSCPGQVATSNQEHTNDTAFLPNASALISEWHGSNA